MVTTVYIDASGAVAADTAKFVRTVASETTDTVYTAARLTKRVTGDSTLANSHGGPGLLFQRGYGSTDANDKGFALLGASYEGVSNDHEFNFFTSTDAFATAGESLLTLSRKNANFNMPVGIKVYANATARDAAITNPVVGMLIYNTAQTSFEGYTASGWAVVGTMGQTTYTLPAATTSTLGGVIIPAVGTSGITNSTGTIGLATASTTQLGAVKVDGSTITINGSGVISANTNYTLPTASTTTLGGVKVDGTTITVNGSGVITAAATSTLAALTDVAISSPANGQWLRYNPTTSKWVNDRFIYCTTGANAPTIQREMASTSTNPTGVYATLFLQKKTTDQASGVDEGGTGFIIGSKGTNSANDKNIMSIGALHNSSGNNDFIVNHSNDSFTTQTTLQIQNPVRAAWYPTLEVTGGVQYPNVTNALFFLDKTNNRVGINNAAPASGYALDVTGKVRATTGFVGNLTGNADTVTNGVYTTGSYADPAWITSLSYSKLTGTPTITTSLDGLTDVTITNAQKGKFLIRGATDWVDTSTIEFDSTSYRPKFVNNSNPGGSGANSAAEFLKNTGDAPATGDGTGILFGSIQSNGTKKIFSRLISTYESSELHKVYIQSSNNSFDINSPNINNLAMFAGDGSQIYTDLTVSGGLTVDNGTLTVDKTNNRVGVNITSPNFTLDVGGSSYVSGYATFGNDIEIQGGDLVTNQTTFNLINTNATTVNFAGAATTVNIGNASGNVVFANTISTTGNATVGGTLKITGEEIKDAAGTTRIEMNPTGLNGTTKITGGAWVTGNLQVDGTVNFASFNPSTLSTTTLSVAEGGSFTVAGTSPSTFNGGVTFNKGASFNAPIGLDEKYGSGNILTTDREAIITLPSGTSSSSLYDGDTFNQMRYIINQGGSKTVYVGTAGWKSGSNGQINFTGQGGVLFIWMGSSGGGWHVIAGRNYTLT